MIIKKILVHQESEVGQSHMYHGAVSLDDLPTKITLQIEVEFTPAQQHQKKLLMEAVDLIIHINELTALKPEVLEVPDEEASPLEE